MILNRQKTTLILSIFRMQRQSWKKQPADADGNLVFNGEIGFKQYLTVLNLNEKLGYGFRRKKTVNGKRNEFKVNGVKAALIPPI